MRLPHRKNRHVFLPSLFPSLSGGQAWLEQEAGEESPPPGVTAELLVVCSTRVPRRPAQPVCRKAMVARCADFSLPLALSSPWSGGQGISVKATQTRDLLNPSQLLQVQEKQIHRRGPPALVKHISSQEIPPPTYTFSQGSHRSHVAI